VKRVVGVAELVVSNQLDDVLITYALGSCLGISIYDPVAKVAGLLHVMLPLSSVSPEKAREKPAMFVDTGVPLLFKESYRLGAKKESGWPSPEVPA
jgi:chemotaxis protein CheD